MPTDPKNPAIGNLLADPSFANLLRDSGVLDETIDALRREIVNYWSKDIGLHPVQTEDGWVVVDRDERILSMPFDTEQAALEFAHDEEDTEFLLRLKGTGWVNVPAPFFEMLRGFLKTMRRLPWKQVMKDTSGEAKGASFSIGAAMTTDELYLESISGLSSPDLQQVAGGKGEGYKALIKEMRAVANGLPKQ